MGARMGSSFGTSKGYCILTKCLLWRQVGEEVTQSEHTRAVVRSSIEIVANRDIPGLIP